MMKIRLGDLKTMYARKWKPKGRFKKYVSVLASIYGVR